MSRFSNLVWHTGDPIDGYQICSDGTYIYVAANGYIAAYEYSGGVLNELARESRNARNICSDGTYIYTNVKLTGVYAYSFDGASFTQEGYLAASRYGVGCDSNYIYSCSTIRLYVYTFNGSSFTEIDNELLGTIIANEADINIDSNYITCNTFIYTFNGSTLSKVCEVEALSYLKMRLFPDISNNLIYGVEYNFTVNLQGVFHVFSFDGVKTRRLSSYINLYSNLRFMHFNNGYVFVAGIDATGPSSMISRIYVFRYTNSRLILKEIYEIPYPDYRNIYDVFADNSNVYIIDMFDRRVGVLDFDYTVYSAAAQPISTLLIPISAEKAMYLGSKVINDDYDSLVQITDYKNRNDFIDVLHNTV